MKYKQLFTEAQDLISVLHLEIKMLKKKLEEIEKGDWMIIEDPEQTYQLTIDIEAMKAYNESWGTMTLPTQKEVK